MLPDLERLIRLQELESSVERARVAIAGIPGRLAELDERVAAHASALEESSRRLADGQAARRELERNLAAVQTRLSRFKDQLMEVKTNKEYQAMQKEIASADHDVRSLEDRILEHLMLGDDLSAEAMRLEAALAADQQKVGQERRAIQEDGRALEREIARAIEDRDRLVQEVTPSALALFERVARVRRGVAVAEARHGHCTICHVRLRPQAFNEIRRNEAIIQCDSCQRILYFAAATVSDTNNVDTQKR